MKTKLHLQHFTLDLLAALILSLTALLARAQDTVTVSAADFQRLVYSAHLHTELALKPELEASLQVLLEMQRRNPNASPAALADLSAQALQRYRTNAPAYIRTNGFRDEILAAYLDALRQVPAHTNFVPASLTLLNNFMLGPADYPTNKAIADVITSLVDSGNQRLFQSEGEAIKRQALVDDCVARAQGNAVFAAALDGLLSPETGVSLGDTPAEIIANTNSPLYNDVTMTNLLALSRASGNGSLTVSTNQVMDLFSSEMQTLWDTIHTNLAVMAQINQSQPDLLAYLTNQAAINANVQLVAQVQQGQPARIACATAAVLVQSQLLPIPTVSDASNQKDQIEDIVSGVADFAGGIAALFGGDPSGVGDMVSGGIDLFDQFSGIPSKQEVVQAQITTQLTNIVTMLGDVSANMNYRFDRVDESLTTIFDTMNQQFSNIEITLDAQGRLIAILNGNVDDIRSSLVDVQASLNRLEQDVFFGFATSERNTYLITPANAALFFAIQNPGHTMTWDQYSSNPNYENDFYTYAASDAKDDNFSPYQSLDLAGSDLEQQLTARPLEANLNYIKQYLSATLGQSTAGSSDLANPQEWFMGAYAYMQLAVENPMLFREKGVRVPAIIGAGQDLTNFLGSLTFSGASVNWPLYTALENYYLSSLISFNDQVAGIEGTYATNNNFAVGTWRQWDIAAPRVTATATEVLGTREISPGIPAGLTNVVAIAGSGDNLTDNPPYYYGLALRADGTVVGWGLNNFGQTNVPAGLSNAVAIAAGTRFSLALKADGTVVGWGDNTYGQTNVPADLSNAVAIAAGADFGLALKADGTVVAWGDNYADLTNIPSGVNNVVAIAAGRLHCMALKANGTVVAWGDDAWGQANVPAGLSNVVAIAGAYTRSLALKANGTVVSWGSDFGYPYNPPAGLSNVVAIAGGFEHDLALKADGTIVGWGDDDSIPPGLSNVVAIAASSACSFFLTTTNPGGSVASGGLSFVRAQIPARLPALLQSCNQNTIAELGLTGSDLDNAARELSGAKLLLADVLELGMPYTLAHDDVLHGFLYGSESLTDTSVATNFLQTQNAQLQTTPNAPAPALVSVDWLSSQCFQTRLNQCLTNLQTTGQPEIPRLVGHTLRLLNLFNGAWTQPTNSPPPALEMWSTNHSPCLLLYGEPYMRYTLQYSDNLGVPGWTTTTITNLQDEQTITPPFSGSPQRFYRTLLPTP